MLKKQDLSDKQLVFSEHCKSSNYGTIFRALGKLRSNADRFISFFYMETCILEYH